MVDRANNSKIGAALVAMTIVAGASAFGTAPVATASCVSAFGLSSGPDCQSGFGSIAIAIGDFAIAKSYGALGLALAVGQQSSATATPGSVLTVAAALGTESVAYVNGALQAAISAGTKGVTVVGDGPGALQFGNVAVNFGNHAGNMTNGVSASGFGNLATNLGGNVVFVEVTGLLNNATNIFGSTDVTVDGGVLSWAINVLGTGNQVTAGPGFLAIAASLGQSGAIVKQAPFGININGAAIPAAAGVNPAAKTDQPEVRGAQIESAEGHGVRQGNRAQCAELTATGADRPSTENC